MTNGGDLEALFARTEETGFPSLRKAFLHKVCDMIEDELTDLFDKEGTPVAHQIAEDAFGHGRKVVLAILTTAFEALSALSANAAEVEGFTEDEKLMLQQLIVNTMNPDKIDGMFMAFIECGGNRDFFMSIEKGDKSFFRKMEKFFTTGNPYGESGDGQ